MKIRSLRMCASIKNIFQRNILRALTQIFSHVQLAVASRRAFATFFPAQFPVRSEEMRLVSRASVRYNYEYSVRENVPRTNSMEITWKLISRWFLLLEIFYYSSVVSRKEENLFFRVLSPSPSLYFQKKKKSARNISPTSARQRCDRKSSREVSEILSK